jgi:polar amino acid transport system substrate-binding protein
MKFLSALLALLMVGCASPGASPEARSELAPTGKLRAGINLGNPALAKREKSGEASGIALDLGRRVAERLGVEFAPVFYPNAGGLVEGAQKGEWDIGFAAIDPARADTFEFTAPYMEVSVTLLVPAGSPIQALADADRAGVRIGVGARNAADLFLTRNLKQAELVRVADNLDAAVELLQGGRADAYASNREGLLTLRDRLSGFRIVDRRFYAVEQAIALPRGKKAGLAFVSGYVEELKRSGDIGRAIERNALRGVEVAPAK